MKLYQAISADPAWQPKDKLPGKSRGATKNYKTMKTAAIGDLAKTFVRWIGDESIDQLYLQMSGRSCAIADDAILFLWRLSSMQTDALEVTHRWGFTHKSELVWAKYWPCKDCRGVGSGAQLYRVLGIWECATCKATGCGTPWFGMGRYVRNAHETCLIATRGAMTTRILTKNIRSVLHAPVPCTWTPSKAKNAKPGQMVADPIHSAKPERFYTQIVERLVDGPYLELFGRRRRRGWTVLGNQVDKFARVA